MSETGKGPTHTDRPTRTSMGPTKGPNMLNKKSVTPETEGKHTF